MELDLQRRAWVFRDLRDQEGETLGIICDSPLSLPLPTFDPSAHPLGFTFTIHPESNLYHHLIPTSPS